MRKRGIKKQFWCNTEEAIELQKKAERCNMSEADVIRKLIMGVKIREKPDNRFYEEMKQLRSIGNNLNQIAKKANSLNFIDYVSYQKETEKLNQFIIQIKKEFLLSQKN